MGLYAQHGYGKSDKIDRGIVDGQLSGVILSPKDERPDRMHEYIQHLNTLYPKIEVFFDPQFYATTIIPINEGKLSEYEYFTSGLTRRNFMIPSDLTGYVRSTIDYQIGLGLNNLISPSVFIDDFNDPWSQIELSLAVESQVYHSSLNRQTTLYISLCINETALRNLGAVNEFLDMLSILQVGGFYIIIRREGNNCKPQIEPTILQNLLYLCYVLSTLNQYDVILGYTDFVGIPLYGTGIKAISCGWHNTLREFSYSRFQPSTGGRRPRERYTSEQLINSILRIPELDTINRLGRLGQVLSNTRYDSGIRTNPTNSPWTLDISCLHHWEILDRIMREIDKRTNVTDKFDYILELISQAETVYNALNNARIIFEDKSGSSHLQQWRTAIEGFRNQTGV